MRHWHTKSPETDSGAASSHRLDFDDILPQFALSARDAGQQCAEPRGEAASMEAQRLRQMLLMSLVEPRLLRPRRPRQVRPNPHKLPRSSGYLAERE